MALSRDDIKKKYPLPVHNYRVSILSTNLNTSKNKKETPKIACSQVDGLSMDTDIITYKHGFSFVTGTNLIPGKAKPVRLSIFKGVTSNGNYFSDWMKLSYPRVLPKPASLLRKRNILIELCDENGAPLIRWTILKAIPVKLEAPSFNAATNDVAFERLDLIAPEMSVEYNL